MFPERLPYFSGGLSFYYFLSVLYKISRMPIYCFYKLKNTHFKLLESNKNFKNF